MRVPRGIFFGFARFEKQIKHLNEISLDGRDLQAVENMLVWLHERTYEPVRKRCRLPIAILTDDPKSGITEATKDLALPSAGVRAKSSILDARSHDPSPALARYHCHELIHHIQIFYIADTFDLNPLKSDAKSAFELLLCDCWNAPEQILEVIKLVWASARGKPENDLRGCLLDPIVARIELL